MRACTFAGTSSILGPVQGPSAVFLKSSIDVNLEPAAEHPWVLHKGPFIAQGMFVVMVAEVAQDAKKGGQAPAGTGT